MPKAEKLCRQMMKQKLKGNSYENLGQKHNSCEALCQKQNSYENFKQNVNK